MAMETMMAAGGAALATTLDVLTPGMAAFYAAAGTAVVAFLLVNAAAANRVGVLYSVLFALVLGLLWLLEGGLTILVPGTAPAAELSAALTMGFLAAAFGLFTAERAIDPALVWPRVRTGLRALALLSLVLVVPAWPWPGAALAWAANGLLLAMFAAHLAAIATWRTATGGRALLPLATAAALVAVLAALLAVSVTGAGPVGGGVLRVVFLAVTLPTMAAVGAMVVDVRRARDAAREEALAAARKDAATSAALFEMEKNYARARDTAARRARRLATASHDIRQPIASLRAELDALGGRVDPEVADRLGRILDHFDDLTADLSGGGRGNADAGAAPEPAPGAVPEEVPARLLLATLERMFGAEARTRGLDLRVVPGGGVFLAPPVPLMRIASNLVANAVAHSGGTRVLVGTRRRGGRLVLEVADDGAGFPGSRVGDAYAAGVKGAASQGSGLGLSIVRELADTHGFTLDCRTAEGRGTRFSVTVPARP
ncbi:MAG: HAMP domain-containing histidine kinase [Hyphomicrobiales bacterium]|nr:HAMP domain-containing histidine kinase [Hyphomicrobiales bacterium]MCP5372026.1 HAMP domain-containing histidine kinase [Hyphomicrobiales bacterium]